MNLQKDLARHVAPTPDAQRRLRPYFGADFDRSLNHCAIFGPPARSRPNRIQSCNPTPFGRPCQQKLRLRRRTSHCAKCIEPDASALAGEENSGLLSMTAVSDGASLAASLAAPLAASLATMSLPLSASINDQVNDAANRDDRPGRNRQEPCLSAPHFAFP